MHILLTGAAGFTGEHLVPALRARGHEVTGTRAPGEAGSAYRSVDLLDPEANRQLLADTRPEAIIHLAARSFVADNDHAGLYATNLVGTRNLLAAAAAIPSVRRVILASSANMFADPGDTPITEATPPAPANDYAISKLAMEQLPGLWPGRFDVMVTRPFNYTGRGQSARFLVAKITEAFRARQDRLVLGNLDVWRDFSDVRDVVAAYCGLVESSATGTVHLCSGRATSLRDIVEICGQITGHRPKVVSDPAFMRANDIRLLVGSNARLRTILPDWSARPFGETLAWMLESDAQAEIRRP